MQNGLRFMKYYKKCVLTILLMVGCTNITADICTQTFQNSVQSNTLGSTITFACGTKVLNNSTNALAIPIVNNPAGCATPTCGTSNCTSAGTTVSPLNLGSFQSSSNAGGNITIGANSTLTINNNTTDYNLVSVRSNATLNFSANPSGATIYRISSLELNNSATVNFATGDYWIDSLLQSGGQPITINIVGTGTTRIYLNTNTTISRPISWNVSNSASQLLIYAFNNLTINSSSASANAIIYAAGDVNLTNFTLNGALTAKNITLSGTSVITYNSAAVTAANFGTTCPFSSVSQFVVTAPSTGSYCQNMTVAVTAQNAMSQTETTYARQITLTTQSNAGTWISTTGGGALSSTVNGAATYQFVAGDNGVANFRLSYPNSGASPITIKAYQTDTPTILGNSGSINFAPSSLVITDNPVSGAPTAFSSAQTAGTNFTLYLTAYSGSSCGVVTNYTGTKTIRFYTTYVNPTTGTLNAKINGVNIANSVDAVQTTQPIIFNNGVATVIGSYSDAGQLMLNVADTASGGPSGQSGNFVVKPYQFAINIPGNSATQTTAPPAGAVSACLANAVFKKAGVPFTVNVQAQNAQGTVTPNYGLETVSQGILLTSSALLAPTNGRNGSTGLGTIGNGSTFSRVTGAGSPFTGAYYTGSNFYFDEAGCINLTVAVGTGSYLGAGNVSNSTVVGRFIPDHFSVSGNVPLLTTGCSGSFGSFTYLDKPFLYTTAPVLTVTAQSLQNTTTQNYTGNFWKLSNSALGNIYNKFYDPLRVGDIIPNLIFSAANSTPSFLDEGNGVGTFTFSDGGGFKIQRLSGSLAPPFRAEIQLNVPTITDSDGVICTGAGCVSGGFAFGLPTAGNGIAFTGTGTGSGKQFFQGRLIVLNSSGSQLLPLTLPMQTQVYTASGSTSGFAINALDSCTTFNSAANLTITQFGVSTIASLPASPATFSQGILNITLNAPTPAATGYVDVEANISTSAANLPWLQYNWPYNGITGTNFSANPRGRGTFGVFKGNDRVIYQQEITQ